MESLCRTVSEQDGDFRIRYLDQGGMDSPARRGEFTGSVGGGCWQEVAILTLASPDRGVGADELAMSKNSQHLLSIPWLWLRVHLIWA